jgi:tetratricopeptide (TPR) repeat protein
MGFTKEARKCYKHVTGLDKSDREAWIRLAFILLNENDLSSALDTLREAYQNNFTSQDILYMLSAVYFRTGDELAGIKFFEKAIDQGEGGRHLFFEIFPDGRYNEKIRSFLTKN